MAKDHLEHRHGKFIRPLKMDPAEYDTELDTVTSFESQMTSLKTQGFQRPWRPYQPPKNMEATFAKVCSAIFADKWSTISKDFSNAPVQGLEKAKLLSVLAEEFGGHRVPNSLLHTMTTLDQIFTFYSTAKSDLSPYDRLEMGVRQGVLPQNLHVQLEPKRFDADDVTVPEQWRQDAYPRDSTLLVTPEAQKRWKHKIAKRSPYKNSVSADEA